MKRIPLIIFLFLLIVLGGLFSSSSSFAGSYRADGRLIRYEGFVPCGKSEETRAPGESIAVTYPCQFCHIFVMIDGIWDFIVTVIVIPVGTLMLVIGGLMFFFGGGDPGKLSTAKKILTTTVAGLAIIFGAFMITETIFTAMGVAEWTGLAPTRVVGDTGVAEVIWPGVQQDILTDDDKNWTGGQWGGWTVLITGGTHQGEEATIVNNGNTTLYIERNQITGLPLNNVPYEIYRMEGGGFQIECPITL